MPLSECYRGEVLDFHYKVYQEGLIHSFHIGELYVGQIFRMGKTEWTAVSRYPNLFGAVDGFRSRYCASAYLLKIWRLHNR